MRALRQWKPILSLTVLLIVAGLWACGPEPVRAPAAIETLIADLLPLATQAVALESQASLPATATPASAPPPTPTPDPRIEALLASMTLEEKIGQMLMIGVLTDQFDGSAQQAIRTGQVGGIWLTRRNATDVAQLQSLIAQLQHSAQTTGAGIGLMISIDHEGGDINRLPAPITAWPSNMALAAAGCETYAQAVGGAVAAELLALGINVNLAPVLDLTIVPQNPVVQIRAYGDNPTVAGACGSAYVQGLQQAGVLAVVKHFPGHGSTADDSHADLPTISVSLPTLQSRDLQPFETVINHGVSGVMVGHLLLLEVDPEFPASVSPAVVTDILRNELGFTGLVFTDDLAGMGAINRRWRIGPAALLAVQAGADVLVMNAYFDSAVFVRDALLRALANGSLSEARIDQSVRRILQTKAAYGLLGEIIVPPMPNLTEQQLLADAVGTAAVTVWPSGANVVLPQRVLLVLPSDRLPVGLAYGNVRSALGVALQNGGLHVSELNYHSAGSGDEALLTEILRQARLHSATVVVTWDAGLGLHGSYLWQRQMVARLVSQGTAPLVVAMHTPYDLPALPGISAYLMTYGATPAQVNGLAAVLLGRAVAEGNLPIDTQFLLAETPLRR